MCAHLLHAVIWLLVLLLLQSSLYFLFLFSVCNLVNFCSACFVSHAGELSSINFANGNSTVFSLNSFFHQQCHWILDSKVDRKLTIEVSYIYWRWNLLLILTKEKKTTMFTTNVSVCTEHTHTNKRKLLNPLIEYSALSSVKWSIWNDYSLFLSLFQFLFYSVFIPFRHFCTRSKRTCKNKQQQKQLNCVDLELNQIVSEQSRSCSAWNISIHEYSAAEESLHHVGPQIHLFCPRDRHKVFNMPWKLSTVVVR